jgi:hypothetical protein
MGALVKHTSSSLASVRCQMGRGELFEIPSRGADRNTAAIDGCTSTCTHGFPQVQSKRGAPASNVTFLRRAQKPTERSACSSEQQIT